MYQLVHLKLPTGEAPICNVTLEPYVLIKKDSQTTVTADDIPEEGSGEGTWQLRSRWYRSTIPRSGGAVCSLHPEKPATVQCTVCLRCKVAPHLSYHCTPECFKGSWQQHKEYHRQAHANGECLYLPAVAMYVHRTGPLAALVASGGSSRLLCLRSARFLPAKAPAVAAAVALHWLSAACQYSRRCAALYTHSSKSTHCDAHPTPQAARAAVCVLSQLRATSSSGTDSELIWHPYVACPCSRQYLEQCTSMHSTIRCRA